MSRLPEGREKREGRVGGERRRGGRGMEKGRGGRRWREEKCKGG